ncbi:MAG TPA: HAD family phosphatase [Oscillatoriales cyanobacterium M59_W2019_021]|nr:MAG: HAD family phosphatase [Cyanobacteria bacterium J055]HIK30481.1 HAD family phosphatase [Oscillatoriales cyanobacterium M4454_W2019_049]HIK49437.1 HAD family phosphatase [Oscillatoriales cyanobacterium M59_W2019_021]
MTPDIQLLVLDIDGTISGKSNQIREPVLQAIHTAQTKGVKVALATGRMYRSALSFYELVGSQLPLICYQGAWIQEPLTNTLHRHLSVATDFVHQLLDEFEKPDWHTLSVHFYIDDRLYVRELTPHTRAYIERSQVEPIVGDLRSLLDQFSPTKVLALSDDTDAIDRLYRSFRQRYTPQELYLTKSVATFFEAANPLVNKGAAVQYLAEDLLGLDRSQVMTIGDNFNDVEMIAYAGVGVAMGDAPAEVRQIADWVAPGVEEDGVAVAIDRFILQRQL